MPRRGNVPKRDVLPDPVYGSKVVTKLVNQIMLDGNKATAQKIVYEAFDIMKEKLNKEPLEIFNQAMTNVMPVLEVKERLIKVLCDLLAKHHANLQSVTDDVMDKYESIKNWQ